MSRYRVEIYEANTRDRWERVYMVEAETEAAAKAAAMAKAIEEAPDGTHLRVGFVVDVARDG